MDVYNILLEGGLPDNYKIEDIKKNDKTGQIVVENLDSTVCLKLSKFIHGNLFFNKKVYVSSVVQKTPAKDITEKVESENAQFSCSDSEGSDSEVEEVSPTSKPPKSRLFSKVSDPVKRPAQASPETTSENKKKDKKKKKDASSSSLRSSARQATTKK